jgi:hypothetical protein
MPVCLFVVIGKSRLASLPEIGPVFRVGPPVKRFFYAGYALFGDSDPSYLLKIGNIHI